MLIVDSKLPRPRNPRKWVDQPREAVFFNGLWYYRYPEHRWWHLRKYFWAHPVSKEPPIPLHVAVYVRHFGPIPTGFHVHHRDGNTLNNDPANLTAVDRETHERLHSEMRRCRGRRPEHLEHLAKCRAKMVKEEFFCTWCEASYRAYPRGQNKFCSATCRGQSRATRLGQAGRDKAAEKARAWRVKNPTAARAATKRYREAHAEERRAYSKKYMAKWREANRERIRENAAKWRARRRTLRDLESHS